MRYRYFKWDPHLLSRIIAERGLRQLFNHLLLQLNGDVDRALSVMKYLQTKGILNPDLDLDDFIRKLEADRIIEPECNAKRLTPKGERWLREDSLNYIFSSLKSSGQGSHPMAREGAGTGDILPESRSYEFGDPHGHIDFNQSFKNAFQRSGLGSLELSEEDLAVREVEANTSAATVLLLDISHSMILYGEDRITPAKQVAMALAQMIKTQYPKDSLDIVTFGDEATRIELKDLPYTGVGPYHTNTQEGLQVGRELLLQRKSPNRQIFMITDGKPTVVRRRNGEIYRNSFGLDPYIENRTLDEALICRKKNIIITTFMVTSDPYLRAFVERLTELNRGRAYFTPLNRLGGFIFRDFMTNRSKRAK
jgi:Ca-activated chloride channel homolog